MAVGKIVALLVTVRVKVVVGIVRVDVRHVFPVVDLADILLVDLLPILRAVVAVAREEVPAVTVWAVAEFVVIPVTVVARYVARAARVQVILPMW